MTRYLSLLLFTLLTAQYARANHATGGPITFRALDSLRYEVTFVFYRDCRGVAFGNPSSSCRVGAVGGNNAALSLSLISIEEVTPYHDTVSKGCTPAPTRSFLLDSPRWQCTPAALCVLGLCG